MFNALCVELALGWNGKGDGGLEHVFLMLPECPGGEICDVWGDNNEIVKKRLLLQNGHIS